MRTTSPLLAAPYVLWLLAAFAAPLGAVALLSVQDSSELFAPLSLAPSASQYAEILGDRFYLRTFLNTLGLGAVVTLVSVALAYPMALWLTRLPPRWKPLGFACVLVPLLTNVVVRSLGIILLLGRGGILTRVISESAGARSRRPAVHLVRGGAGADPGVPALHCAGAV